MKKIFSLFSQRFLLWICLLLISFNFVFVCNSLAQVPTASSPYWAAMPPYNTLWPLWLPIFSPVDNTTGLPTPIVTSLTPNTELPVQPCLTWHPFMKDPWLLYNTPLGMAYYDPLIGIDLWPPKTLINASTGLPMPIFLPSNYEYLVPPIPLTSWLATNLVTANTEYQNTYYEYSILGLGSATTPLLPSSVFFTPLPPFSTALPFYNLYYPTGVVTSPISLPAPLPLI